MTIRHRSRMIVPFISKQPELRMSGPANQRLTAIGFRPLKPIPERSAAAGGESVDP